MCFPGAEAVVGVASAVAGFAGQEQQFQAEQQRYVQNYADALSDNRADEK